MERQQQAERAAPAAPSFGVALIWWFKLGCISFGGPAGQIAVMHRELVEMRRWISEKRFLHALNYCMVLPGPEAQQLATYIGWLLHGARGGIAAGALFVLPSLALLIGLSWGYMAFGAVPAVAALLWGIKPAVVAVVAFAAWRIGKRVLRNGALWALAIAALLAIAVLRLPFPAIILAAALLGALGGHWRPSWFRSGGGHAAKAGEHWPALIDDDTPPPAWARFSWRRLAGIAAIGLALWALVIGIVVAVYGFDRVFTPMALFFSKAALLTFGGAYAVLPYVYQAAVEHYQWLSAPQMIDGLALGESTPGPLIMVTAFVGFVGAWQHAGIDPFLAGVIGACVATWFTFLPSFVFILAGGPLIESTHDNLRLTAPLTAISAAVVGVIANLALFFAWHVFWPAGVWSAPDWPAVVLALLAAAALFSQRLGMMPVLGLCALAGLVRYALS
ncbi:chromate transporter [Jeongeupia sp. HS-3]|uniref:chromate efflux transporter n=1 Tax=Jeongeupia sp. HS-3 TaxID=1009682 RepID=UPI0018A6A571|nr:chromate efflux transporter [Jeongeupia sp. HS-3]BCL74377.1 chromate transporter [Jeongeupia sp. HS-3]